MQTPALRIIGNIVSGEDLHTQLVLNLAVLPCLHALLLSTKISAINAISIFNISGLRKEACWTLSNILAGTPKQINHVIQAGIIPSLVELIRAGPIDVRVEACFAVSNAAAAGDINQIRSLKIFYFY